MMPAGFLSPFERDWLLGLLFVWAALLLGGFVFGKTDEARCRRMPEWTRMGSSLALVVAGWDWYLFSRGAQANIFALLIASGMTLGFVGDLALAELLPLKQHVLGAMGAFGLGHIAYISGLLWVGGRSDLVGGGGWGILLAWLLIGAAGWHVVVLRPALRGKGAGVLHWAALLYALLLATTAGLASRLALQAPPLGMVALGSALFLFSDLLVAARLFSHVRFFLIDDVVWLTYGPGQMLIVYAIGAAWSLSGT